MTMFFSKKKERLLFGKAKPMEDVSLEDFQKNPIWVFAFDEEGNSEQDETWLKPVINSTNVTFEMVEAYILLQNKDENMYASACLDIRQMKLYDVSLWIDGNWISENKSHYFKNPTNFYSVPSIKNKECIYFEINISG